SQQAHSRHQGVLRASATTAHPSPQHLRALLEGSRRTQVSGDDGGAERQQARTDRFRDCQRRRYLEAFSVHRRAGHHHLNSAARRLTSWMMPDAYHELANVVEVKDASELTIPRAKALFGAVQRQRDYSLVQILRHPVDGDPTLECLVVEVECDDV